MTDRALKGEGIVITRRGEPVVELKPVRTPPRPITEVRIEWLRAHRFRLRQSTIDAAAFVRQMRDDEWEP